MTFREAFVPQLLESRINDMKQLTQDRLNFIERVHEVFFIRTGYGAFAYVSVVDVMQLFDQYLVSDESADIFIEKYVKSV